MKLEDVTGKLISIHREYQKDGGYNDGESISEATTPLSDLAGFDSDFIPEIVRRLAKDLGIDLPVGTRIKNIYVSHNGERKLSIRDIGRQFLQKYAAKAKAVSV